MFRRCLLGKLIFIFQINFAFPTFEGEGEKTGENKREGENKGWRVNSVISENNKKQIRFINKVRYIAIELVLLLNNIISPTRLQPAILEIRCCNVT